MTPAVHFLRKTGVSFSLLDYSHDSRATSYGLEAAEKLNQPAHRVFKTLVVESSDGQLAVAVIPVKQELNLKALALSLDTKKVKMANPEKVERTTGYVLGGVSPIAQKRLLPTYVDDSATQFESIFISAGKRGLEIELSPSELVRITQGRYEPLGISK